MLAGTRCRQGRRRTILMTVSIKTFDARLDRIVVCIRCVKVLLRCGKHHLCVFPTTHHQSHDLVRRKLRGAAFRMFRT